MRKIFVTALLAFTLCSTAQTTKEVELSIKHYDMLNVLKENEAFNFIGRHDKMIEHYDTNNKLAYIDVVNDEYKIRFFNDMEVQVFKGNAKYYVTIFDKALSGYGFLVDESLNRILTYYLQNDKILKQSVIK